MNRYPSPAVRAAVAGETLPALVVDVDAVDANAADMAARAGGTRIRLASKSVRIPELIAHVLEHPSFSGTLSYVLREAMDLVRWGITDDAVVGYPTADAEAVAELAADDRLRGAVTLMVDSVEHLDWILEAAASRDDGAPGAAAPAGGDPDRAIRVCMDVDASWRPVPALHIGARRSPTHTPRQAAALAREIAARPGLKLVGVMMYEGHIAGLSDGAPGPMGAAIRLMQKGSRRELAKRRAKVVRAVEAAAGPLEFVNGGGTGSLESTGAEDAVTEIAAGSGLIGPGLFDHYRAFLPHAAEWFVLPVVRRPAKDIATVLGGGRIASGPAGEDRLPTPEWPEGLTYIGSEGPGEVQTPLAGDNARGLRVGDPVWFRHAKAGEGAEHANIALGVAGGGIIGRWETYRGKGRSYA
ncbi:alanine racemase [Corynebacterium sp. 335C]